MVLYVIGVILTFGMLMGWSLVSIPEDIINMLDNEEYGLLISIISIHLILALAWPIVLPFALLMAFCIGLLKLVVKRIRNSRKES